MAGSRVEAKSDALSKLNCISSLQKKKTRRGRLCEFLLFTTTSRFDTVVTTTFVIQYKSSAESKESLRSRSFTLAALIDFARPSELNLGCTLERREATRPSHIADTR